MMTCIDREEAIIFANDRPSEIGDDLYQWAIDAEDMIRSQHTRIADIEAQLAATKATGVPVAEATVSDEHIKAVFLANGFTIKGA